LTANANYSLSCTGTGGNASANTSVTVTALTPSVNLTANPTGVARNATSMLTWTGTNVASCTASGGWTGTKSITGTQSVGPITQDTTYSLNCTGPNGNAMAMTTLSLREAMLSWQAPTQNVDGTPLTNLASYKVYYGPASHNYTQSISVTNPATTQQVITLQPGTWYFAVTAIDAAGSESAKSNEVSKTVN
jgi:hypothetical protein